MLVATHLRRSKAIRFTAFNFFTIHFIAFIFFQESKGRREAFRSVLVSFGFFLSVQYSKSAWFLDWPLLALRPSWT